MKFVVGGIAGAGLSFLIIRNLGAHSSGSTPAVCNNGGCMVPALIAGPIIAVLVGGIAGGLGYTAGSAALLLIGLGHAL